MIDALCDEQLLVAQMVRSAYFAVRVKLSLSEAESNTGDPYSVLSVQLAGSMSQDEVHAVLDLRRQYAECS